MTNRMKGIGSGNSFMFVLVLLISACDGGIFGTGGPDDLQMTTSDAAAPMAGSESGVTAGTSATDQENNGSTTGEMVEVGNADTASESDTINNTEELTDAGSSTNPIDGMTDSGSANGGATDAGSTDEGGTDSTPTVPANTTPPMGDSFTNNAATLNNSVALINLVNTSGITVNVIETTGSSTLLFDQNGVAPNSVSSAASPQLSETSLDVVDNNTRAEVVFSFPEVITQEATFTTLLVRQNGSQIDAVPLVSSVSTTDAALAKVRLIQATSLGDAAVRADIFLESAGANPGGIDEVFGPLSFVSPITEYIEVPNGDYEFRDLLDRFNNQMVSFAGGNAYTVFIVDDDGANSLLVVNDTEAALQ